MIWIGKGIATIGVWAGSVILGYLGIVLFGLGPILGMAAGFYGTVAIWAPKKLDNLF